MLIEGPVKRKRGRPKGSTKKVRTDLTEVQPDTTHSPRDDFEREEERNQDKDQQYISAQGIIVVIYCVCNMKIYIYFSL